MDTKNDILKKAMELFSLIGYDAVGVSRIVEGVGLTKPTLYHYFGNKEGLLASILDAYEKPFLESLKEAAYYNLEVMTSLENVTIYYIQTYMSNTTYYQLKKYLHHSPKNSDGYRILKPFIDREHELLYDFFKQIAMHHTRLKGYEKFMVYSFLGLIDAYTSNGIDDGSLETSTEDDWRLLAKQLLYGIFSL